MKRCSFGLVGKKNGDLRIEAPEALSVRLFRSQTVYYGKQDSLKHQLLRAEWAGVVREEGGRDVFQSPGAAHPHWHVDGLRTYFREIERQLTEIQDDVALRAVQAVAFGEDEEVYEEEKGFDLRSIKVPEGKELSWTSIHLAANARWAQNPWPGISRSS